MTQPADDSSNELLSGHLAKLDSLLRLLTPDHPFQPILTASIDLSNWQASFTRECKLLLKDCQHTSPSPDALKACEELYGFAAELFAAPYFAHYLADEHPDHDAGEFLPEPDFFKGNCHLQEIAKDAREVATCLKERATAAENLWQAANTKLYELLTALPQLPCTSLLESTRSPSEDGFTESEIRKELAKLCNPEPCALESEKEKNDYDDKLWHVQCYLTRTLLPQLTEAAHDFFPAKDTASRSKRQVLKGNVQKAIDAWLTRFDIVSGWRQLIATHDSTLVLQKLLRACHDATGVPVITKMNTPADRLRFFEALRALPVHILQERRLGEWQQQIEEPDSLSVVAMSLCMLCEGTSAVGSTTLTNRLTQEASSPKSKRKDSRSLMLSDAAAAEKKTLRVLSKLLTNRLAIHGSQNWVHLPLSSTHRVNSQILGRRNPGGEQGWLINPLSVLLEPVGEVFRDNARKYIPTLS